jgi:hypothetical protein
MDAADVGGWALMTYKCCGPYKSALMGAVGVIVEDLAL